MGASPQQGVTHCHHSPIPPSAAFGLTAQPAQVPPQAPLSALHLLPGPVLPLQLCEWRALLVLEVMISQTLPPQESSSATQ